MISINVSFHRDMRMQTQRATRMLRNQNVFLDQHCLCVCIVASLPLTFGDLSSLKSNIIAGDFCACFPCFAFDYDPEGNTHDMTDSMFPLNNSTF